MYEPTLDEIENITALREQGDLRNHLLALAGRAVKPEPAAEQKPAEPDYEIAHPGAWPIGTAASGPTPTRGRCTCPQCDKAAVVQLPRQVGQSGSEAA
jgi:hypothetical protein